MASAAALRAQRRRDRILMNSEDRMKKIFGGENYHENHLTIVENEDICCVGENEKSDTTLGSQLNEQSVPKAPQIPSPDDSASTLNKEFDIASNESSVLGTIEMSVVFWCFWGSCIKFADVAGYSWTYAGSALLPYIISFATLAAFRPGESRLQNQNSAGVTEIVAQLAGIRPAQISAFKCIFKTVMNLNKTFCAYFLGFLAMEVIIQYLF